MIRIGCVSMFKMNTNQMDLDEVKALVEVTEEFVAFAAELLEQGDILQEEYDSMTKLKKQFLNDVKMRYFR